jgi:hypothetical protein
MLLGKVQRGTIAESQFRAKHGLARARRSNRLKGRLAFVKVAGLVSTHPWTALLSQLPPVNPTD